MARPKKADKTKYVYKVDHRRPMPRALAGPGKARRGKGRPATSDKDYTEEELAFLKLMDGAKRAYHTPHPTWAQVLGWAKLHGGYRKVE